MIVYPARDIAPFVMYSVNGKPRSSLLIELVDDKKKNKKPKWRSFHFARRAPKHRYYGDVIHSFYWNSAVEHDGGV